MHYPNCSMGGVSSVIRGRAVASPESYFHFVAFYDKGGVEAFKDLPNVEVHIIQPSRIVKWINYVLEFHEIDEVSILSSPEIVDELEVPEGCQLVYEFHSSHLAAIEDELHKIDTRKPDLFRCPTQTMADSIGRIVDSSVKKRLAVVPNLIDTRYFHAEYPVEGENQFSDTPLIWVGRLDKGKGLKYALRTLAQLPDKYSLHAVFSLTDSPKELEEFLGEAYALGVHKRLHLYQNMSQEMMASFFQSAAISGGALLSTSLNESYGYVFHEATATGLPIYAFELPVLSEFPHILENSGVAAIGDIYGLADRVLTGVVGRDTEMDNADPSAWTSPRWQDFMELRLRGKESRVPWFLHDKLKAFRFCEENGFPTAKVLRVFDTPEDIDLTGLTGEFVLKPTLQSSMKGVMVLEAVSGSYYDSLRRRTLSHREIMDEQAALFERTTAKGNKLIVEEKIADIDGIQIPRDFKAYAFDGEIALILEIDRNTRPSTVAWSNGDFEPLPEGTIVCDSRYVREATSRQPPFTAEMLALAKKVSSSVPSPFARIDMYLTDKGPLVGEITLTPGGLYYGQHYRLSEIQQRKMGRLWKKAVLRTPRE